MSIAGVISLTIQSARIIPWSALLGGPPDPFVSVSINGGAEAGKTGYRTHDFNPSWMETKFIVLRSLDDFLTLSLFNHHEHRKHRFLGESCYKLSKLKEDVIQSGLLLSLLRNEKPRGEILIDVIYYPLLQTNDSSDSSAGVVSLLLPQARNLDASGTHSGHLSPFAKVYLGYAIDGSDDPVLVTKHQHHSLHPIWNAKHDFYCPSREACVISLQVIDDHRDESIIGHLSLQLNDLLDGNETGAEWWPMSGCRTGEVMMHAVWRPLNLHSY